MLNIPSHSLQEIIDELEARQRLNREKLEALSANNKERVKEISRNLLTLLTKLRAHKVTEHTTIKQVNILFFALCKAEQATELLSLVNDALETANPASIDAALNGVDDLAAVGALMFEDMQ